MSRGFALRQWDTINQLQNISKFNIRNSEGQQRKFSKYFISTKKKKKWQKMIHHGMRRLIYDKSFSLQNNSSDLHF